MEIKTKTIAPFIAAAATAQGAYDEIAQECVADLAEELELNDLQKEVEAAFKTIEKNSAMTISMLISRKLLKL